MWPRFIKRLLKLIQNGDNNLILRKVTSASTEMLRMEFKENNDKVGNQKIEK